MTMAQINSIKIALICFIFLAILSEGHTNQEGRVPLRGVKDEA